MRVKSYGRGSYVHIIQRGTRNLPIVLDDHDRKNFLRSLFYLNRTDVPQNWKRDCLTYSRNFPMQFPPKWHTAKSLVSILAYALVENHFHLILEESTENGISRFMHKMCTSLAKSYNEKNKTVGTLFQSSYKAKIIDTDSYMRIISVYVQVKNGFDLLPGGLTQAKKSFQRSFDKVLENPYVSLGDYLGTRRTNILTLDGLFSSIHGGAGSYKNFAKEYIKNYKKTDTAELELLDRI